MCLWARGHCFCCCTKDLVGFIFATILCILRKIIVELPHRLQLSPLIAAESRIELLQMLLHAVSVAAGGVLVVLWHSREA